MRHVLAVLVLVPAIGPSAAAAVPRSPTPVSPGAAGNAAAAAACPTFTWASPGDAAVEIAVFALADSGVTAGGAVLRQPMPAGAGAWTPAADRCLPPGVYAWTVRTLADGAGWSPPRLFRVEPAVADPLERAMERAVERVLERWLAEGRLARAETVALAPAMEKAPRADALAQEPAVEGSSSPSFIADHSLYGFPDCTEVPPIFSDVPNEDSRCPFIKQFAADEISTGCGGGRFCPDNAVTRGQLAVYVERAMRGTGSWDVNADLLDGLDSTAFLQLAGGAMAGPIAMQDNLVLDIGNAGTDFTAGGWLNLAADLLVNGNLTLAGASPLVFEGATVNANDTVLGVADPSSPRTITLPDASGEVSLLGQAIEAPEIADLQRALPVPITSLLNCTSAAAIDFANGADSAPDFAVPDGDNGLRLTWDVAANADNEFVCATFAVPPDYASGGMLRVVSERGAAHNNSWFISYRVLPVDGTFLSANFSKSACDAGGTAGDIYLCDFPLDFLAADSGVSFALARLGGSNAMTIYALQFVYTAVQ